MLKRDIPKPQPVRTHAERVRLAIARMAVHNGIPATVNMLRAYASILDNPDALFTLTIVEFQKELDELSSDPLDPTR